MPSPQYRLIRIERLLWPVLFVLTLVTVVLWNLQPVSGPQMPVEASSRTCWHEDNGIVCGDPSTAPEASEWVK